METIKGDFDTVNISLNSDQNKINQEQLETIKVEDDIVNDSLYKELDSSFNQNNISKEQTETNKISSKIKNTPLSITNIPTDNKKKRVISAMDLITKIINENKIKEERIELEVNRVTEKSSNNNKKNDEFQSIKEQRSPKNPENMINETKSFIKQEVDNSYCSEKSDYGTSHTNLWDYGNRRDDDEYYENERSFITSEMQSPNNNKKNEELHAINEQCSPKNAENMINEIKSFMNQEIDNSCCSKKSYYDLSHTSPPDHRNGRNDDKYYENGRSFMTSEMQFKTENFCPVNILPPEYSLAFFVDDAVCLDDFSSTFSNKFGTTGFLMDQHLRCGDVGEVLSDEKQYAFYLVFKRRFESQSSIFDFEKALNTLLQKMMKYKLTKLAIPQIELEKFVCFKNAKKCIKQVFEKSDIEVTLCTKTFPICRSVSPIVSFIPIQLWQMKSQSDLIMFINLEEMYLENWRDEVVENVDARYPFKNKLLNDISIKSLACGDVLTYKIDCEMLFCIFFNHENPTYFTCIERAFNEIKSQLTGFRYLGIQHNSVNFSYKGHSLNRHLNLLRTINFHKIFICGQYNHQKYQQMQLYQKTINDAIEMNKIESPKFNANTEYEANRKKHNTYNFPRTSVDNSVHNKTLDNNL